eukprot:878873-Amphidinium_carterae.1
MPAILRSISGSKQRKSGTYCLIGSTGCQNRVLEVRIATGQEHKGQPLPNVGQPGRSQLALLSYLVGLLTRQKAIFPCFVFNRHLT